MLYVRIRTKPITRFLRFIHIPFFYVGGSHFRISAYITNFEATQFQGGELDITVRYAFGSLAEFIIGKIGAIDPNKEVKADFEGNDTWGVLAQGHALFMVRVVDKARNPVNLCDENGKPLQGQLHMKGKYENGQLSKIPEYRYHVHTFHSLTAGELYSLIALTVNTVAFATNVVLTIIVNDKSIWSYPVTMSLPAIVTLIIWLAILWIFFANCLYDHYGL